MFLPRPTVLPALLSALLCAACATPSATAQEGGPGIVLPGEPFSAWLQDFRRRAIQSGRPERVVDAVLGGLEPHDRVIELDQDQPEFERPIWQYLDNAVSETRIETGRTRTAEAAALFAELQERYGVDAPYLAAVWGLESAFGDYIGDFDAARSLATLAWEGRRRDLFETELLDLMDIIASGAAAREDFVGGWAGALGQTQFMPSTYLRYAVDHDGDGRKDIWENRGDALSSAANYLSSHGGWRPGEPWGVEVKLPEGFDLMLADGRRQSVGAWAVAGVTRADDAPWGPEQFLEAQLLLPAGAEGPAFLTFPNFDAFRRYNNATAYALAAGLLGDAIAGKPPVSGTWPRGERSLLRTEIMELQRHLNALGYDTQGVDGRVGPDTRAALRKFQTDRGMEPDAFATAAILERARADVAAR